ncbi:MAG: hotdog fold thioesterase [Crocinitomicaceae bacterium]|nr:hotdog fold thioesterase [Crocinitomicaceae bacterium]
MKNPQEIIHLMLSKDAFSNWLGIEVIEITEGKCTLACKVTESMLNGFDIAHGGISYSLSDSALAFAANSRGFKCVSIETSISHTRAAKLNDILTARCTELHRGRTTGIYQVIVSDQHNKTVSLFKGTVKILDEIW